MKDGYEKQTTKRQTRMKRWEKHRAFPIIMLLLVSVIEGTVQD